MDEEKFYTIKQVGELLGVHRTTIYDWMSSGRLGYVQVGERRRVPKSALDAFIKAGEAKSASSRKAENDQGNYAPGLALAW